MTQYLSKTKESDGRNVLHFIKHRIFHLLIPRKMNKVYLLFAISVVYCILFVALSLLEVSVTRNLHVHKKTTRHAASVTPSAEYLLIFSSFLTLPCIPCHPSSGKWKPDSLRSSVLKITEFARLLSYLKKFFFNLRSKCFR